MGISYAPECHSSGRMYPTRKEVEEAAQSIATILHDTLCRYDHTEGCSWELYDKEWNEGAHEKWLEKAYWILEHGYSNLEKYQRVYDEKEKL